MCVGVLTITSLCNSSVTERCSSLACIGNPKLEQETNCCKEKVMGRQSRKPP